MEHRLLGKTGMNVSVLGFGGSEIGYQNAAQTTVETLLSSALDSGLNVIDTAECYLASEELIGRAVGHRRKDYYLFTKCGHAAGFDFPDWHPRLLEQTIERSLRRLHTDYVDLIQLHSCGEDVLRQGDVIDVLQQARNAGKTRFIGYSGDSETARYAVETGVFDTLQISVNVADQEAVELAIPLAHQREMGVIAKRPVANAAWQHESLPPEVYHHTYWERLRRLDYDFAREQDTSRAVTTALQWTLAVPGVHTAIVGTQNPKRWQQNADSLARYQLPNSEFEKIRERWKQVADESWTGQT